MNYPPKGDTYKREESGVAVFKTKVFARLTRKHLDDEHLLDAIERAEIGLVDADLGGNLIKQRVAREGEGRRGGFRTVIAFRQGKRSVFLYAFPKSRRDNISASELADLKTLAKLLLGSTDQEIETAVTEGELTEVKRR